MSLVSRTLSPSGLMPQPNSPPPDVNRKWASELDRKKYLESGGTKGEAQLIEDSKYEWYYGSDNKLHIR